MTMTLTHEQEEIRAVARQFLAEFSSSDALRAATGEPAGFDPAVWQKIAELGWPAMCLDEEFGGLGFGEVERALLMQEMGYALLASPFLSSAVLASEAVALAGSDPAQQELLPRLAEGELRAALVASGDLHAGRGPAGDVVAVRVLNGWTLSGSGGLAADAVSADVLIVAAALDGGDTGLFSVQPDAPGLTLTRARLMDESRPFAAARFDATPALCIGCGAGVAFGLTGALDRACVALAAEMVGAAQRCLEMCVQYAKERRQFGVPIGSFQVIKHRCAILAVEVDAAREAVMMAAEVLTGGEPADATLVASLAKSAAGEALQRAVNDAVQIHGGIGFTDEHDAHLFFKRARVDGLVLGSADEHRHRIAERLGV
jgi:alkylation response protein AidB-like acyl-CoA dehydrogenase